ncbi:M15 family metallopeptidase [Planococcus salinus]|uniref:M15 family peptidase n=1 Tax=Planococcus salinus TaxID=1848460 RepID=A0A3M8P6H2_9BACL|nr:M15 family metallopeptidase [Planococcus salinus]RNF39265.1 M15 family peptidase [Planococcus salinus]
MKNVKTALIIIFLLVLGGFLFIWVQKELAFREELRQRPLPTRLHPIVAEHRDRLIERTEEIGIDIVITDGFRSVEEQEALYRQGREDSGNVVTYARGGESYHNYGLAIDFALQLDDGNVVWDIERDDNGNGRRDWFEVADIAKELGFEWGGDWERFRDYPHLQMTFGLSIKELQRGWRPEDVLEE